MSSIVSSQSDSGHRGREPAAASPPVPSTVLQRLVVRVAHKDTVAFADLYDALSPQLLGEIRSAWPSPSLAAAIVAATFVEVWTLARFHSGPGDDVEDWITDIAARRTCDRQFGEHRCAHDEAGAGTVVSPRRLWWTAVTDTYDRQYVLCLAALLNRPQLACPEPGPVGA